MKRTYISKFNSNGSQVKIASSYNKITKGEASSIAKTSDEMGKGIIEMQKRKTVMMRKLALGVAMAMIMLMMTKT